MISVEINKLNFLYPGYDKKILSDIDLAIEKEQSVGIIGANGAGKSTLLKILVGILSGYKGNIQIDGINLNSKNMAKIRRKTGYVFQDSDSQLFMNNVYDDIAFGPRNYGFSEKEVDEVVSKAARQTHIEKLLQRRIFELSGGEKKLVSIAGILAIGVDIVMMDEPSVALDPVNRENLIEVINSLDATKIIASHDLDFIYDTCQRTVIISGGKIVADGSSKEILGDREILEKYGLRLPLSLRFNK